MALDKLHPMPLLPKYMASSLFVARSISKRDDRAILIACLLLPGSYYAILHPNSLLLRNIFAFKVLQVKLDSFQIKLDTFQIKLSLENSPKRLEKFVL